MKQAEKDKDDTEHSDTVSYILKPLKIYFQTGFTKVYQINIKDVESYTYLLVTTMLKFQELEIDLIYFLCIRFYINYNMFDIEEIIDENITDIEFNDLLNKINASEQKEGESKEEMDYIVCRFEGDNYESHPKREVLEALIMLLLDHYRKIFEIESSYEENKLSNNIACNDDFLNEVNYFKQKLKSIIDYNDLHNTKDKDIKKLIRLNQTTLEQDRLKLDNIKKNISINSNQAQFVNDFLERRENTNESLDTLEKNISNKNERFINSLRSLAKKAENI